MIRLASLGSRMAPLFFGREVPEPKSNLRLRDLIGTSGNPPESVSPLDLGMNFLNSLTIDSDVT
jgi:hypothetical protein